MKQIKIGKILVSIGSVVLLLFVSYIHAQDEGIKKHTKTETPEPTQITSDRLDAYNDKRMVVFSGNAVAIQGNKTITADRIVMYYKEKSTNHKKTGAMEGTFGELERIEACGHVQITQDKRIAKGKEAIFYQDEQKIIIKGNAVMSEDKNIIRGEKIVLLLRENRGYVESGSDKRVTATIYPEGKKENKK